MGDRLERLAEAQRALAGSGSLVVLALEVERLLAGEDPADDLDVLAGAGERLGVGLAVPALDDLRPRRAEPEDEPPPERWSRVSAVIAVAVGVRAEIWQTAVPSRSFVVLRAPPGERVKQSEP